MSDSQPSDTPPIPAAPVDPAVEPRTQTVNTDIPSTAKPVPAEPTKPAAVKSAKANPAVSAKSAAVETTKPAPVEGAKPVSADTAKPVPAVSAKATDTVSAKPAAESPLPRAEKDELPAADAAESTDKDKEEEKKKKEEENDDVGILRWDYVRPRLLAAAVVTIFCVFLSDPTLRWTAILGFERTVRSRLDIADLRTKWSDLRMEIDGIAAADRSRPGRNHVSADKFLVQFDRRELLRGRYVVTEADLQGVALGTERGDDGLPHFSKLLSWIPGFGGVPNVPSVPLDEKYLRDQLKGIAKSPIKTAEARLRADLEAMEFETPAESKRIQAFWELEIKETKAQATWIQDKCKELKALAQPPKGKVLDQIKNYEQLARDGAQLMHFADQVRGRLQNWTPIAQQDARAIRGAAERDYAKLRKRIDETELSAEDLSEYFLGDEVVNRVKQVTGLVRWARSYQIGDDASEDGDPNAGRLTGTYHDFFPGPPVPQWWLKTLKMSGRTELENLPVKFRGNVTDISSHPARLPQPTALHVDFDDPAPAVLDGTLDRRTSTGKDTLTFRCPRFEVPARALGKKDDLEVRFGSGAASLEADLEAVGLALKGSLRYSQPQVGWTVHLAAADRNDWAATAMEGLAGRSDLRVDVDLGGTLDRPTFKVRSDFPREIADRFRGQWKGVAEQLGQSYAAKLTESIRGEEGRLGKLLQEEPAKILGELDQYLNDFKKLPQTAAQPLKAIEKLFRK